VSGKGRPIVVDAPSNLGSAELTELVGPPLGPGLVVGMKVVIFGPDLDPDGRIGAAFATALVDAVSRRAAAGACLQRDGSPGP
jgi:arginase family enzyme